MKRFSALLGLLMMTFASQASWYWPFGSDDSSEQAPPRLSELMEPASLLIDEASDLAYEGKTSESIEKYREALSVLDRIEAENPERAQAPEFASLRNKRAYVNAAIDSMLMTQVQQNAKAVAVSDTTELERRWAEEKAKARGEKVEKKAESKQPAATEPKAESAEKTVRVAEKKPQVAEKKVATVPAERKNRPLTKREQAMADIEKGDYAAADLVIREMLVERPNGAVALNLRAVSEIAQNRLKDAERTLDQAIMSNPRNYFAFYNMARLLLRMDATDKLAAKRYYETGRQVGGPEDPELEGLFE